MTSPSVARAAAFLIGSALALGCAEADDASGDDAARAGTCDLRDVQQTCIEAQGSQRFLADQRDGCEDATGVWSNAACPATDELIGCCEYTFGNAFRECFYEGTPRADPEAYCLSTELWTDGVWTPAGS